MSDPAQPTQPVRRQRWLHRLGHSLQWRLVALFLLLALGMTAAFLYGTQKAMALGWRDAVRPLLSDYVDRLAADLGTPPDVGRAQALAARLPISVRIEGPTSQLDTHPPTDRKWRTGNRRGQSKDPGSPEKKDPFEHDHPEGDGTRLLQRVTSDGHTITFGLGDLNWRRGPGMVFWITLTALLALTGIAYAVVRRLLKPLDDIGAGARRFGAGDFATPIAVRRRDELGDLAGQINTMGQDIHQMLEAKRALLLAISHELRSPLTRARLNTELLPDGADTHAQREGLLRDLAEMARLITDLLESERLASRHAGLQREAVDIAQLAQDVVASLGQPGKPARIALKIAPELPRMQLDPVRIRLLLRNLLDNALRYSALEAAGHAPPEAPPCELDVRTDGGQLILTVRDHGPGVPEAQLPLLMQPFYRPDSARQRSTGGVGLGLYLCQLVARAHGGSLLLSNASPGLRAVVTLPIDSRAGLP